MSPNEILVHNVQVTEADMSTADVLIGMDVITLGDFALTNLGGKTRFTFSVPSPRSIDFVQEGQAILKRAEQHGSAHSKSQLKIQRKKERKNKKQGHKA